MTSIRCDCSTLNPSSEMAHLEPPGGFGCCYYQVTGLVFSLHKNMSYYLMIEQIILYSTAKLS